MKKFTLITLLLLASISTGAADSIIFIVNGQNPVSQLSAEDVRNFYFKKKRRWPDDTSVRFIDRSPGSPLRDSFLRNYLHKTGSDVELYWIGQKLYTGDSAPLKESSDEMTMQFVAAFKGAIGYVSSGAQLGTRNVKAVKIEAKGE
jgi:ABC-type phosphate transport system substrate-binding protein